MLKKMMQRKILNQFSSDYFSKKKSTDQRALERKQIGKKVALHIIAVERPSKKSNNEWSGEGCDDDSGPFDDTVLDPLFFLPNNLVSWQDLNHHQQQKDHEWQDESNKKPDVDQLDGASFWQGAGRALIQGVGD